MGAAPVSEPGGQGLWRVNLDESPCCDRPFPGPLVEVDPDEFPHAELPAPKPWTGKRRKTPAAGPALATVSEVEVEASAGPGAFAEEFVHERARWRLPEVMVRHEGHADPDALRILRVRGNSMEPELREGDRVVVDTARRVPLTGEMFVLWVLMTVQTCAYSLFWRRVLSVAV